MPFPEDCIQSYVGDFWEAETSATVFRGRLIRAFVPFCGQQLHRLTIHGRAEAREHARFNVRIEPYTIDMPRPAAALPVAAMPLHRGEDYFCVKGKVRPAVVVSAGGPDVPDELRRGLPRRHTAPAMIVAPYFSIDQEGRAGYPPQFVERVRRAEYPHFLWDKLPIGGAAESLLRLDYLLAMPKDPSGFQLLPHRLTNKALALLDDWLAWLFTGGLDPEGDLGFIRDGLTAP